MIVVLVEEAFVVSVLGATDRERRKWVAECEPSDGNRSDTVESHHLDRRSGPFPTSWAVDRTTTEVSVRSWPRYCTDCCSYCEAFFHFIDPVERK